VESKLFLLDTSVWIAALKKEPQPNIREKVEHLLRENLVAIPPIVKVELLGGTRSETEFERLRKRLNSLVDLDIDSKLWNKTARLAYDLRRKGVTVPYTDILIAATAINYSAILLHMDRHFDIIAEKSSLKAENLG